MIKNDEYWIWYSLTSVYPHVDEILVFDNYSEDRTVEIVRGMSHIADKLTLFENYGGTSEQLNRETMLNAAGERGATHIVHLDGTKCTPTRISGSAGSCSRCTSTTHRSTARPATTCARGITDRPMASWSSTSDSGHFTRASPASTPVDHTTCSSPTPTTVATTSRSGSRASTTCTAMDSNGDSPVSRRPATSACGHRRAPCGCRSCTTTTSPGIHALRCASVPGTTDVQPRTSVACRCCHTSDLRPACFDRTARAIRPWRHGVCAHRSNCRPSRSRGLATRLGSLRRTGSRARCSRRWPDSQCA